MNAVAITLLVAGCSPGTCFLPSDDSPGWKRVALPAAAPDLAAPEGIEQIRGGEPAIVWTDEVPVASAWISGGHAFYEFAVRPDQRALEIVFAEPLDGARVASSFTGERRVRGRRVLLAWQAPVERVSLDIHKHLRQTPVVHTARAGSPAVVAGTQPGVLYYKQPRGSRVTLCEAPERTLTVGGDVTPDVARPVSLRRSYARLPSGPVQ
jgi:hypothetical protein